jgi:hypothetical protein
VREACLHRILKLKQEAPMPRISVGSVLLSSSWRTSAELGVSARSAPAKRQRRSHHSCLKQQLSMQRSVLAPSWRIHVWIWQLTLPSQTRCVCNVSCCPVSMQYTMYIMVQLLRPQTSKHTHMTTTNCLDCHRKKGSQHLRLARCASIVLLAHLLTQTVTSNCLLTVAAAHHRKPAVLHPATAVAHHALHRCLLATCTR